MICPYLKPPILLWQNTATINIQQIQMEAITTQPCCATNQEGIWSVCPTWSDLFFPGIGRIIPKIQGTKSARGLKRLSLLENGLKHKVNRQTLSIDLIVQVLVLSLNRFSFEFHGGGQMSCIWSPGIRSEFKLLDFFKFGKLLVGRLYLSFNS